MRQTVYFVLTVMFVSVICSYAACPVTLPVTDGLAVHFDASEITGYSDGDDLLLWPDVSGNGNDAGDAGYSYPSYQTNVINGLPVIHFEDTDGEALAIGATTDLDGQQKTVFAVAAHDTVGGDDFILRSTHAGAAFLWGVYCDSSNYFRACTLKPSFKARIAPEVLGTDFHILSMVYNSTSGSGSLVAYNDGAGSSAYSDVEDEWRAHQITWVGGDTTGSRYFDGDIAEILIYNRILDDAEKQKVGAYLELKYNLDTSYEYTFPVGEAQPTDGSSVVYEKDTTSDEFDVMLLCEPGSDVEVIASINDPNYFSDVELSLDGEEGGSTVQMVFTPSDWYVPQTVTVTALQDTILEITEEVEVGFFLKSTDPNFADPNDSNLGILMDSITVLVIDDDSAGVTITPVGSEVHVSEQEILTDTYQYEIVLVGPPSDDVVISIQEEGTVDDILTDPSTVTFTPSNYNTPQVITVECIDDEVAESTPETSYLTHIVSSDDLSYDGFVVDDLVVLVDDNDCGIGPFLAADINEDCSVDMLDFAEMASMWLECSLPNVPNCVDP